MRIYEYGEPNAKNVLLQPVGDPDRHRHMQW